ncbi:MAG: hypothetical protein H0T54_02675 [Geodermatophilaceae bacterium]|nr:hypothetical protein [Geodermatophilaceae bacterium]
MRRYLSDEVVVGVRRPAGPDQFAPFVDYARLRLGDDPHLWASALHDELAELGFRGSYSSMTRSLRARRLRPHCEACTAAKGRDHQIIEHPAGEETQLDWLETGGFRPRRDYTLDCDWPRYRAAGEARARSTRRQLDQRTSLQFPWWEEHGAATEINRKAAKGTWNLPRHA